MDALDPDIIADLDPFEEMGRAGLRRSGGTVEEEWHPKLNGQKAVRTYREMMDNDATIGATLYLYETLIKAAPWKYESADPEDERANEWAEFAEECRQQMAHTWTHTLSEILTMMGFGWSLMEPVYHRREDGKIGWKKVELRGQETLEKWHFDDETGELRAFEQRDPATHKKHVIPAERFVLFRPKAIKNNPEGWSMLRPAYRAWYFKKRIETLEAIGAERDLAGLPVVELPPKMLSKNASAEDKAIADHFKTQVQQIRRDERMGLVIPAEKVDGKETGFKFYLASTGGKRQVETNDIIERLKKEIATTMLAQFMMLGMDGVGSYSLASSMTSTLGFSMAAVLGTIADTWNRHLTAELMELNGVPRELWPVLKHGDVENVDLKSFADTLNALVGASVLTPDDDLEDHVREYVGLPQRQVDDIDMDPSADPALMPPNPDAAETEEAFNGIQIRSAAELIRDIRAGKLPKSTVRVMLTSMLRVPPDAADAMLADVEEGDMPDATGPAVAPPTAPAEPEDDDEDQGEE